MLPFAVLAGVALWGCLVWYVTGGARRKRREAAAAAELRPRWLRSDGRCITCGLPVLGPHVAETVNVHHCLCVMTCLKCAESYPRWSHHAPICSNPACRGMLVPAPL
jgi:hypothetical protein